MPFGKDRRSFLKSTLGSCVIASMSPFSKSVANSFSDERVKLSINKMRPPRKIAFGSCCLQDNEQKIWKSIGATNPDLFLFLGDNIYGDTLDMGLQKAKYDIQSRNQNFEAFSKIIPINGVWDDHDYGLNDSGRENNKKFQSKQNFLNFIKEPANTKRRKRNGIYTSYFLGPDEFQVQIIMLDLRWFRSPLKVNSAGEYIPNWSPQAAMLGTEQWQWLERQIALPSKLKIICSSIQVVAEDHRWEKWSNFPLEKMKLYDLLDKYEVENCIFISGDMHFGEISIDQTQGGQDILEVTSSGLTHFESAKDIPNSKRQFLFDQGPNFGLLDFFWSENELVVRAEIRNEVGQRQISTIINFDI